MGPGHSMKYSLFGQADEFSRMIILLHLHNGPIRSQGNPIQDLWIVNDAADGSAWFLNGRQFGLNSPKLVGWN
jgi:hypothetical protein